MHFNGNGTLHGGVYTSFIYNAMGLSVSSLVGLRTATTQMNVHFLGVVRDGCITCKSEVLHKTRRTATVEASVYVGERTLVAMGTYRCESTKHHELQFRALLTGDVPEVQLVVAR